MTTTKEALNETLGALDAATTTIQNLTKRVGELEKEVRSMQDERRHTETELEEVHKENQRLLGIVCHLSEATCMQLRAGSQLSNHLESLDEVMSLLADLAIAVKGWLVTPKPQQAGGCRGCSKCQSGKVP